MAEPLQTGESAIRSGAVQELPTKNRLLLQRRFRLRLGVTRFFLAMPGRIVQPPGFRLTAVTLLVTRPVILIPLAFVPRPLDLTQRASQRLDLTFVGVFLPVSQFGQFEHFLHLIEELLQRDDDLVDVFNRLTNGRLLRRWIAGQLAHAAGHGFENGTGLPGGRGCPLRFQRSDGRQFLPHHVSGFGWRGFRSWGGNASRCGCAAAHRRAAAAAATATAATTRSAR